MGRGGLAGAAGLVSLATVLFMTGMPNTLLGLGSGLALIGAAMLLTAPRGGGGQAGLPRHRGPGRRVKSILIRKEAA